MGGTYMTHAFIGIIALFGQDGLTKKEVLEINKKTYRADMEGDNEFNFVDPRNPFSFTSNMTEYRDGKYHIKEDVIPDLKRITNDLEQIMKKVA